MVLPSVIRPVACAEVPVQAAGFCFHSLAFAFTVSPKGFPVLFSRGCAMIR